MAESSGEKTEKPSSKRKEDARKRGDVSKSHDLVSAAMMVILFAVVKASMNSFVEKLEGFAETNLNSSYVNTYSNGMDSRTVTDMFSHLIGELAGMMLPILAVAFISAIVLNVVQTGFIYAPTKLKPDFKKINPLNGFKRIFSSATIFELGKSILKTVVLAIIIIQSLRDEFATFSAYSQLRPAAAILKVFDIGMTMGIKIGGALLALAIADVIYQWWKYQKDLRMTKQEVKEENKQLEGDPQIKSRIRQKQRQMSMRRMMQNMQNADVVITNPTHYAVALRYKEGKDAAPVVLAKGADFLAQKIKEKARELNITIVENKPVARALYAACEIGDLIPENMYQAIADILIYVYRQTNRVPKRAQNRPQR